MARRAHRLSLNGEPRPVAVARRDAAAVLTGWGLPAEVVEDARLVISELTANAVQHAGGAYEIRLVHQPGHVTVFVQDAAPRVLPEPVPAADEPGDQEAGRGLAIVQELARSWGCTLDGSHKTVWAAFPVGPDSQEHPLPRWELGAGYRSTSPV